MLDQANIACGFHAGDPAIMVKTVKLAKKHGKVVGAHPGLPDKEGFGRRLMDIPPESLYAQMLYQVGALKAMLDAEGMPLNHIKPHGKLYRMIKDDEKVGEACMKAIKTFGVPFVGLPGTAHETLCQKFGIEFIPEFFPDLWYDEEGQTVPILTAGRVPHGDIKEKMSKVIKEDTVVSVRGSLATVPFNGRPFTCCIHSDLPGRIPVSKIPWVLTQSLGSVEAMKSVKAAIEEAK